MTHSSTTPDNETDTVLEPCTGEPVHGERADRANDDDRGGSMCVPAPSRLDGSPQSGSAQTGAPPASSVCAGWLYLASHRLNDDLQPANLVGAVSTRRRRATGVATRVAGRRDVGGSRDLGQATTEYALVLLAAALVAVLVIGWATTGGGAAAIGNLFNKVINAVIDKV